MEIERLIAVKVEDERGYTAYRKGMTPILHRYGGRFMVDARVSEVLLAPGDATFNRIFTIRFPTEEAMGAFFQDPAYVEIKRRHFSPSVSATHPLSMYPVEP